jgi:hypothetical protein
VILNEDLDSTNYNIFSSVDTVNFSSPLNLNIDKSEMHGIRILNKNEAGLGLYINAGSKDYNGSLAILNVADKDDNRVLIAKANGSVVAFGDFSVGNAYKNEQIVMIKGGNRSNPYATIGTLNQGDNLNITTSGGTLHFNDMAFPAKKGNKDDVLTADENGNITWKNINRLPVTDHLPAGQLGDILLYNCNTPVPVYYNGSNWKYFSNNENVI